MNFSIKFITLSQDGPMYILSKVIIADSDEMPHFAAFHLGLHCFHSLKIDFALEKSADCMKCCLPKCSIKNHQYTKRLMYHF